MKPEVKWIITDVPMYFQHEGLNEIIKTYHKKKPKAVGARGLYLLLNRPRTRCKLFSEGGAVLGYLRMPHERRLTLESLDMIPETFGGSVTYSRSVREALKGFLKAEAEAKESA